MEQKQMIPTVLIGSPGSGKGTQGKLVSAYFGIPHISTGEILRDHVQRRTLLGLAIKGTLDKGLLVPDDLMEDLIISRLKQKDCDHGYVLDGYPRTVQQAEWYYAHYGQPLVVLLDVPEDEVLRRIAARNEGRPDDGNPTTVLERLDEYRKLTTPVIEYYEREADLHRVDGTIGVNNVFALIKNLMESNERFAIG
jgi:adenylate kinase